MAARFSTVSLMREEADVIARFVSYYRGLGACEIMIYHDGPADHLAALDLRGVRLTICDTDFWQQSGGRPEGLEDRQAAVYSHALGLCRADWLLVIDADEYVFGDRSVEQFLDWVPASVASVRLPTAEAVWGPEDNIDQPFGCTYFRRAWTSDLAWKLLRRIVYGDLTPVMRQGLAGHVAGKQFLRAAESYSRIGNHTADQDGREISVWAASLGRGGEGMHVGHFDAISYARWRRKWEQRLSRDTIANRMAGSRTRQMAAIAKAIETGDSEARAMFRRIYGLTPRQVTLLTALGYLFRRDVFGTMPVPAPIDKPETERVSG